MCRILGIVSGATMNFRTCLSDAPRSMGWLSREHAQGWGIALHDGNAWNVQRSTTPAHADPLFAEIASAATGKVLVAHVRKRTVGDVCLNNTHPFQRGEWVFAHNGTIDDVDRLSSYVSPQRAAQIRGRTDSEILFAFLLTHIDSTVSVDEALLVATSKISNSRGSFNFVMARGGCLYAYRHGRSLFMLTRPTAILVASEPLTEESWHPLAEHMLIRLHRGARLTSRIVDVPASQPELPFTD